MRQKEAKTAERLFIIMNDAINNAFREKWFSKRRKGRIKLIRFSTKEHYQQNKPWKSIFYVKIYCPGKDKPSGLIGVGSLDILQISVTGGSLPDDLVKIINEQFCFSVIQCPDMSYDDIKNEVLPYYRLVRRDNNRAIR